LSKRKFSQRRWSAHLLAKRHSKEARVWRVVSQYMILPRKDIPAVNLSKISKLSSAGDQVLVPGKVLGSGKLEHAAQVTAFSFSVSAVKGIKEAGGKVLTIEQLIETNPKGKGVKIVV
jgi:large subunit ribosomal protein L18e